MDANNKELKTIDLSYGVLTAQTDALSAPIRVVNSAGVIMLNSADDASARNFLFATDKNGNQIQIADIQWNGNYGTIVPVTNELGITSPDIGKQVFNVNGAFNNTYLFQKALREGSLILEISKKVDFINKALDNYEPGESNSYFEWDYFAWQGNERFSDELDTSDDAKALAIYETQMAKLNAKEKFELLI